MEKDLFVLNCALSYDDRMEIVEKIRRLGTHRVYCSACESSVDISFLRKTEFEGLHQAMCIPCFLQNHGNTSQDDIDRVVKIGESQGWYTD